MKIATAPTRNSKRWHTAETSWEGLLSRLRQPKRTGETADEYRRMSRDEQAARKDVGGFVGGALDGGRRRAGAVTERWLITLDQDNGDRDEWDEVTALYPWAMAEYSTHSHLPEKPRLRWVIPSPARSQPMNTAPSRARWPGGLIVTPWTPPPTSRNG